MIEMTAITEEDKVLMDKYNIKTEARTLFYSEGYKYDKLEDALNYARLSAERGLASVKEQD